MVDENACKCSASRAVGGRLWTSSEAPLFSDAEQIFGSESTRQHEDGLKLSRNYLASSLKLRLKLNPRDDRKILGLLENLEQAVLAACKGEDWTNIDREKLIPQIQVLLKREWDKSKMEAASVW